MRIGDRRAAGFYEQCADVPAGERPEELREILRSLVGIDVSGMVGRAGRLSVGDLRDLASSNCRSDFSCRRVAVIDVLRKIHVDAGAEILTMNAGNGGPIAFRIGAMLNDASMFFELGGTHVSRQPDWGAPVTLRGAAVPGGSVAVRSLHATTFSEFVDGSA